MNITFLGAGYVGLVSGIMLSHFGYNIQFIDQNSQIISSLKNSKLHIYEPKLDSYFLKSVQLGSVEFTDNYNDLRDNTQVIFITVGTPSLASSGNTNLSYVFDAIDSIITNVSSDCIIVVKSTVPPGTCQSIADYLSPKVLGITIVSNPEFLSEGNAVDDFLNPDRIIIGSDDHRSAAFIEQIYQPIVEKQNKLIPIIKTNFATSELIKYASNTFLATKIAFINEMANLCEKIDADIEQLSLGVGLDARIGKAFLKSGPGFGGSCFPKDILSLSKLAKFYNLESCITNATITANEKRPSDMVRKIHNILDDNIDGKVIAILGLAFKAGTDDIRNSPAVEIIKLLCNKGAHIQSYDPAVHICHDLPQITYTRSAIGACVNADALIIITEWPEFTELDFDHIYTILKNPIIIDMRNILNAKELRSKNFKYYAIGQKY